MLYLLSVTELFRPSQLYYLISFGCNERCTKCHHWAIRPAPKPIEPALVVDAIKELPSLVEFCIVGGEPLLFKERITELLFSIRNQSCRTVLITNGVLMTQDFVDNVAALNLHIVVSIDTLDREQWKFVRGRDTMNLVLENLNYARRVLRKNQLSLQSVLAEETKDSLQSVRELCDSWGIYHSVQDYMSEGFNGEWTPLPSAQKRIPDHEICHAAGRNLSIMPNGDVFTCFQQSWMPGCQQPLGNLTNDRISQILATQYAAQVQATMCACNLPCKVLKCNQKQ